MTAEELKKFELTCNHPVRKYVSRDEDGVLTEQWEKNKNDEWVNTTEIAQAEIKLRESAKHLGLKNEDVDAIIAGIRSKYGGQLDT